MQCAVCDESLHIVPLGTLLTPTSSAFVRPRRRQASEYQTRPSHSTGLLEICLSQDKSIDLLTLLHDS